MRSVNKVILVGNLTRDPELKQTPNGQAVCTFSIATNREWTSKDSQKHNLTEYHDLVAWAKLAEICSNLLKKGELIYIEGYLKTRNWLDDSGSKRYKTEIVIQDLILLNQKNSSYQNNEELPEEAYENSQQPTDFPNNIDINSNLEI